MIRSSRAWKMTQWDYAAETMRSVVEFVLSNAVCGVGAMIASIWFLESMGWGGSFSLLDAITVCAAIDLLAYRLLPDEPYRPFRSKPFVERLVWGLVRDLISVAVMLGVCGIFVLCVHYVS